ncbi:DEAD/DEAH box helicase [Candidatus Micrarchaeota archaeon]|nr:DEAD/DEAH box helicase [Candidatus Micrarchaeota archaeon]
MKFMDLGLSGKTLKAIDACGYTQPTEVQEKTIPRILAGANLVVRSQTGTGKTAAFGIGIVERIVSGSTSKALVLTPTRELAMQISSELQELGKNHGLNSCAVYGGQKIGIQLRNLEKKYNVLVATPGRLQDLCKRGKVHLSSFNLIVLDEADHMLDIGFQKEVLDILSHLPSKRVTLLFSATIGRDIKRIVSRHMPSSEFIEAGEQKVVSTIDEENLELSHVDKVSALHRILDSHRGVKTLIFMRTKRGVLKLKRKLEQRKIEGVDMLQGNMEQNKRNRVISGFKGGAINIVVATNVAARGLHIENVDLIVNFDEAENKETHLHRVGRTGRMGAKGKVINLISHDEPRKPNPGNWQRRKGSHGKGSGSRRSPRGMPNGSGGRSFSSGRPRRRRR